MLLFLLGTIQNHKKRHCIMHGQVKEYNNKKCINESDVRVTHTLL